MLRWKSVFWIGLVLGLLALGWLFGPSAWTSIQETYAAYQGRRSLEDADPEAALKLLSAATERNPDSPELNYLLAVALRRASHLGQVVPQLAKAAELGWPQRDLKRERMLTLFLMGEFKESEPYLQKLISKGVPDDVAREIFETMSRGYLSEMRLKDAYLCLEYWVSWKKDDIQPRMMLAQIWNSNGNTEREMEVCQEVLAIKPDHVPARVAIAQDLLHLNKVKAALREFERCYQQTHETLVLLGLANCHRRLSQDEQAGKYLEEILKTPLDDNLRAYAMRMQAEIALDAKDYQRALTLLRKAVKLSPVDSAAHYSLGQVLSKLGQIKLAKKHLELSKQHHKDAVRLHDLMRDVMADPDDVEKRFEVGQIFLRQLQPDTAGGWFMSVLRLDPTHQPAKKEMMEIMTERSRQQAEAERQQTIKELKDQGKSSLPFARKSDSPGDSDSNE